MTTITASVYARVKAAVTYAGEGRNRKYTVTAGTLSATAATKAAAVGHLGTLIRAALDRDAKDQPSFAWDPDNKMLWVAVPDVIHGGHRQHALRWTGDGFTIAAGASSGGVSPASDAFTRCEGFTPVPVARRTPAPAGHEALDGYTHRHWEMTHQPGKVLEHAHLDGAAPHTHDPVTGARQDVRPSAPGEPAEVRDAYDALPPSASALRAWDQP